MKIYDKWTLQVRGEKELLLFDGLQYLAEGYDRLHELCHDEQLLLSDGTTIWDDRGLFCAENDAITNGICESNAGDWQAPNIWKFATILDGKSVSIRYYLVDVSVKDIRAKLGFTKAELASAVDIKLSWLEELEEKNNEELPTLQDTLVVNLMQRLLPET
jgi:hypothetical protein